MDISKLTFLLESNQNRLHSTVSQLRDVKELKTATKTRARSSSGKGNPDPEPVLQPVQYLPRSALTPSQDLTTALWPFLCQPWAGICLGASHLRAHFKPHP